MMPALVRGTVVVWGVETIGDDPVVCYVKSGSVSCFTDGGAASDGQVIISQYISEQKEDQWKELLKKSRIGLLQVHDIQRTALTPPALPTPSCPDNQSASQAKSTPERPK
jgi:hypothetical protein